MQEIENKILEYRVDQLEKQNDKIVESVGEMSSKVTTMYTDQELIKQRIGIFTVVVGVVCNVGLTIVLHFISSDTMTYSDNEKKVYYESKVSESDTVKYLREEIEKLKVNNEKANRMVGNR